LIQFYYSKSIKTIKVSGKAASGNDLYWLTSTNDTINYWYSKYYINKTNWYLVANDSIFDTARMELKFIEKDSLWRGIDYSLNIVNQATSLKDTTKTKPFVMPQELYKPLKINLTRPVTKINENKRLQIIIDSDSSIEPDFFLEGKTKQSFTLDFDKRENTEYVLIIPDSMLQDIFGTWNKRIAYKFRTTGKDNYGNLRITLKTEHSENYYLVRLLNESNEVMKELPFTGDRERKVAIDNIPAGSYKFLVIEDANKNGEWDTGNFTNKIQPEKVFTYKDTYQIKGGWDLEVELKF
jgi:hypothetical protein